MINVRMFAKYEGFKSCFIVAKEFIVNHVHLAWSLASYLRLRNVGAETGFSNLFFSAVCIFVASQFREQDSQLFMKPLKKLVSW